MQTPGTLSSPKRARGAPAARRPNRSGRDALRWEEAAEQRVHPSTGSVLTAREIEVLGLMALGLTAEEAAARLCVAKRTVDYHLGNIFAALNVSQKIPAIREAIRRGLLEPWTPQTLAGPQ